jgi:hypothetical protein
MKKTQLRGKNTRQLAQEPSNLAERLAAGAYGFATISDTDFDGRAGSGAVYEVKKASTEIQPGRGGRFRLFKDQHDRLVRHDRDGTAWYIFVLFDVSKNPPVAKMKRQAPAHIGRVIGARGGWFDSGHADKQKEKKLPIEAVFDG